MGFEDTYRLSAHAVILNDKKEVLQVKANYGDYGWGLPGGAIDPGETVHETLARECREELGVDVKIGPLTGVYYHRVYNSHVFIFLCELENNSKIKLSSEHTEYQFFSIDSLSPVQARRVRDCLLYNGVTQSAKF